MSESNSDSGATEQAEPNEQQFAIQRIYVKDLSFEAPLGASVFGKQWKPHINQELSSKNQKVSDDHYEVDLALTVTAKLEDKTAFLVEIHQAGLFMLKGFDNQQLTHVMNTICLQILFPYARESIDSVLAKGSFPPLMLPPVNFDALFAQAVASAKEKNKEEPTIN